MELSFIGFMGSSSLRLLALTTAPNKDNAFSVEGVASLIVAILTLVATVFIAVFVYALQQKDARKATEKQEIGAKKILFTELKLRAGNCDPRTVVRRSGGRKRPAFPAVNCLSALYPGEF